MLHKFWNEPDVWENKNSYFPCVARRNGQKSWCGYVGVSDKHPLYNKPYNHRVPVADRGSVAIDKVGPLALFAEALHQDDGMVSLDVLANVHGGLTYASRAWWDEDSPYWWFGFDCSHSGDLTPYTAVNSPNLVYGEYRDLKYVIKEIETLHEFLRSFV